MKLLSLFLLAALASIADAAEIQRVDPNPATGSSLAVVAPATTMVYTTQIFPTDAKGKIIGKDDAARQVRKAVENLNHVLNAADAGFADLVKINVYVRNAAVVGAVRKEFAGAFGKALPAVSFVEGELSHADALVSLDAVATSPQPTTAVKFFTVAEVYSGPTDSHGVIVPHGKRVYISGMASKGEMAAATADTMKQLWSVLEFLKLKDTDVIQLKAFLGPMTKRAEAERAMVALFEDKPVPPIVFVEWTSNIPIEIELIAAAGKEDKQAPVIEYLTPSGTKASPVYSRVARINSGGTVFTSGIYPESNQTADDQIRQSLNTLKTICEKTGTDLKHLAKATYYVSADDTSAALNRIRPEYYDPARPPAASKAQVRGVAREGCAITLDMIAAQRK